MIKALTIMLLLLPSAALAQRTAELPDSTTVAAQIDSAKERLLISSDVMNSVDVAEAVRRAAVRGVMVLYDH